VCRQAPSSQHSPKSATLGHFRGALTWPSNLCTRPGSLRTATVRPLLLRFLRGTGTMDIGKVRGPTLLLPAARARPVSP